MSDLIETQLSKRKTPSLKFALLRPALALCFAVVGPLGVVAAEPDAKGVEFFEKKIRPILVESCYKCHSQNGEKPKGGLLLDTRDAVLKGGDTGPGVVPGNLEKSLLIKAVRYKHEDLQMPPKGKKLPDEQIADLETWVKLNAPDPRTGKPGATLAADPAKVRTHWAFQPVEMPDLPEVKNRRWVQSPIDLFVLANLEGQGMAPSRQADKRTLIRRVSFDLTGLPPASEEVGAFLADRSPDAFTKVVDRLLASPHYGERWGRHWLDVARYADTTGYIGAGETRYAYSYTYRDYVIRAFNEDLPYDQFLIEQIAADKLPLGEDNRPLAALGFLTLGRRFINNEEDIVDDRIDVIARGTMGLTVTCARCHDHKYDPIPTKDYYSLYGVFKSTTEPGTKPVLMKQPLHPAYTNYLAELKKQQDALNTYVLTNEEAVLARLRSQCGDYLMALFDTRNITEAAKSDDLVRGQRKLNMEVYRRWENSLKAWSKTNHPVFSPWVAFAALPENEFAVKAKELAARFAANNIPTNALNPVVAKMFSGEPPATLKQVADRYGQLFAAVDKRWLETGTNYAKLIPPAGQTKPPPPTALPAASEEQLRQLLYATEAPTNPPRDQFGNYFLFDDGVKAQIEALKKNVAAVDISHPGAPPRAMAMEDRPQPFNPRVYLRGNPGTPGPEVPRRFLEIASSDPRQAFTNGSGRLELARSIASRDNPLTARVLVNRVWLNHFGAGLVRTPSDFGLRADPPTNPGLLDYLAARFMEDGWSLKKLHRLILLSSVYQQSSEENPAYAQRDPENKWLWRMNRLRLDFEAMRDSLLAISGRLDPAIGGQPVDITTVPFSSRRTVYGFIDRQDLPNLFRTFDFASPDSSSPQRFQTIVAPQALFMLNSQFIQERVRNLTDRPSFKHAPSFEARVRDLYLAAFQREPTSNEIELARDFLEQLPAESSAIPEAVAWQYGYGGYDEGAHSVTHFTRLAHFTGTAWQGGPAYPDPKVGHVLLTAEGGHAGLTNYSAIRRWVAPRDGQVSIQGELTHKSAAGDGVRGTLASSRLGELGRWIVHNTTAETKVAKVEVRKGDTVDFVVDGRANVNADSFQWAPVIQMIDAGEQAANGMAMVWDAKVNFIDPKKIPRTLKPWEKYAQVLLLSNELMFVD